MKDFGYLSVQVLNAQGALPIPNALVIVESSDEYDRIEAQSSFTDRDGKSELFMLPAPPKALSETPVPSSEPAALYRVTIYKEGYYPRRLDSISIFEGIYSTLTVSMVAHSLYDEQQNAPKTPSVNEEGAEEI